MGGAITIRCGRTRDESGSLRLCKLSSERSLCPPLAPWLAPSAERVYSRPDRLPNYDYDSPHRVATIGLLSAPPTNAKSIPKRIIQTSKEKNIIRPDWIEFQNSLKIINPDFELIHYSDEEAKAFIAEHYGGTILDEAYDMVTPIMRADLFRLAAIYKLGGFYMDMDMVGKSPLDPIVEAINNEEYQAVFPKDWWMSADFYVSIFPGKQPEDSEDHWQVGQYAFAAVPEHYFVKEMLEETIVRSVNLMKWKGDNIDDITDVDILAATGPYVFTELYHAGRKVGRYTDVFHIPGDIEKSVLGRNQVQEVSGSNFKFHAGPDWYKFGPYCEHMMSWTWKRPDRRGLKEYGADEGGDSEGVKALDYNDASSKSACFALALATCIATVLA